MGAECWKECKNTVKNLRWWGYFLLKIGSIIGILTFFKKNKKDIKRIFQNKPDTLKC